MQMETLPSGTELHGRRYRIERALGSGGFGHVYLSVDTQTNALCAIKEYLVTGSNGKAQLEHEAQVLKQLHHPNLPAFLESFDERAHYYVVLGYIEGKDLTDYIRDVRQKNDVIALSILLEWLLSICDAVSFLHSQRPPIIHRDIKPDNIRITPNGTAILVDLGNAKTAADGARTLFFIRHQGTPGYAPLEQYPGGTGTDERSDVYALGGTLYFALTAHEPPSVSTRNQSLQQRQSDLPGLQERLAQNPPDVPQEVRQFRLGVSKPSKPVPRHSRHLAQLSALSPELLNELNSVIQHAMAMKPADRYPSVAKFSNNLRAVLKKLPPSVKVSAPPRRTIDPNSTQPDLSALYEEMQRKQAQAASIEGGSASTQAPQTQSSAPPSAIPTQQPFRHQQAPSPGANPPLYQPQQGTPAQPVVLRCPRCGTEPPRPAPFCPRCGTPLNNSVQGNGPRNQVNPGSVVPQVPYTPHISDDATVVVQHPPVSRDPLDRQSGPERIPPHDQISFYNSSGAVPIVSRSRNEAVSATSQQVFSAQQQPTSFPSSGPVAQSTVKPFIPVPSPSNNMSGEPSTRPEPKSHSHQTLLIALAIIIVALIVLMLILIVFLRSRTA